MTVSNDDQSFLCLDVSATQMDRLWAEGWRHFGIRFFRYRTAFHGGKQFSVMPLRVDVGRFMPTRSQKRVLAKNRDAGIEFRAASVDETKEALFRIHVLRFQENAPSSLNDFLSPFPDSVPCPALELCIYLDKRLIGVTYLDIGQSATSAVYAMFDPAESKRSVGVLMMLQSIHFSRRRGCRYYYPGYAYREPCAYDYKKKFLGLEYLDWAAGWKPYAKGDDLTAGSTS
jgi:arginine-tRNA-protein transferase